MEESDVQYIWVVSKYPFSLAHDPIALQHQIDKRVLIKQTPKGFQLQIREGWDSFYAHSRYEFFNSEAAAMRFLRDELEVVIDGLIKRRQLCQSLRNETIQAIGEAQ